MVENLVGRLVVSAFSLLFVVVGLYTANRGRVERAQSERIAETETTAVRDLQPGTAEVKGVAQTADDATLLESPITGQAALATYVEMEEWESSGQGGGSWETKHEAQAAVPMVVDDGTGEVRVELPDAGEVNVEETKTEVGSGDEPSEAIRQYVEAEAEVEAASRRDIGPLSLGDRRRYSEGMIEPGEEIYVLGAARELDSDWGERTFAIDEPTGSGDFVLSDKSEEELVREGKRGGLVYLGFGGVLVAVGLLVTAVAWAGSVGV